MRGSRDGDTDERGGGTTDPDRGGAPDEQLALLREGLGSGPGARDRKPRKAPAIAEQLPVARVAVDKPLSHLDQYFDYSVPARMAADAQPGVRVRVRFGGRAGPGGRRTGGRLVDGFIVERRAQSDFPGALAPLRSVVSPEPVLSPQLLALCRGVAARYAGTLADVLQLAVPPRHGQAEAEPSPSPLPAPTSVEPGGWLRYPGGAAWLRTLAGGGIPRAVWTALPGPGWPEELARAMTAALASGRGALAVLPDGRSAARADAALTALLGAGHHVLLTADAGPRERYRRWLAVSRGSVLAVIGTRAAMFAPVRNLGLAALWDDGDSSHCAPQAPQPHAREVLLQRAVTEHTALLIGGHACTVEAAQLVETGWAGLLSAERETVRTAAPLVRTVGEEDEARDPAARSARLPSLAWRTARDALHRGPVLVQVPRRGYVPRLACGRCREPARCDHCSGPLAASARLLVCAWCGREVSAFRCAECGSGRLRATVVGARRTAEELGRAFPSVPVRTSGRDQVLAAVPNRPALVVSTPGAEPLAEAGGYAAALLLDGWALLGRPDLRAGEDALRRWLAAAALVRGREGAADGGTVVVVADPALRPVQALVRWDPVGYARRELGERGQLGLPPVSRMAAVSGPQGTVAAFLAAAELPKDAEVLGPLPAPGPDAGGPPAGGRRSAEQPREPWERALVRVPPGSGAALAGALKKARAARLARRVGPAVRVRIDPPDIG